MYLKIDKQVKQKETGNIHSNTPVVHLTQREKDIKLNSLSKTVHLLRNKVNGLTKRIQRLTTLIAQDQYNKTSITSPIDKPRARKGFLKEAYSMYHALLKDPLAAP